MEDNKMTNEEITDASAQASADAFSAKGQEDAAAFVKEAEDTSGLKKEAGDSSESVKGSRRKKKKKTYFGVGFVFGMLTMLLVFSVAVLILCLNKMIFLSSGSGLVNSELTAKAETIKTYLDQFSLYEINDEDLQKGMLGGLLRGNGDKYAYYYSPEEMRNLVTDYSGAFYGIGAYIQEDEDGVIYVSGTYEDCPAVKAGIKEGDIILTVDGESTEGYDRFEVARKIRGEQGTTVVLEIKRDGELKVFSIVREKLKKIDVEYKMVTDTIGYIYIKDFDDITTDQFAEALATLKGQGMEDMILDLRSNTGGLLRVAIDVANQVMCKGTIVSIQNRSEKVKEYTCDGSRQFGGRIVILTDGYTASASEILAGALKDNGMAITMGTTTYGKGLVQNFYYLSDGSGIKFTTNEYLTPSGQAINQVGIEPDVEVKFDYEAYKKDKTDSQLEAAIEYLEK